MHAAVVAFGAASLSDVAALEDALVPMSVVPHMDKSCPTCGLVMSQIWMSHDPHMGDSFSLTSEAAVRMQHTLSVSYTLYLYTHSACALR